MRIIQVAQRPQLIENLRHNLTFVTDKEVNRRLLNKFGLFKFLTPCDPDNQRILQSIIDEWSDYFNEYFRIYNMRHDKSYEPLTNYHRWEKLANSHYDQSHTDVDPKVTVTENYHAGNENNDTTLTNKSRNLIENGEKPTSDNVASGVDVDNNEIYGNIGVTTAQQMLQEELDLIEDLVNSYCNKFAEAFNLDMEVDFYGGYI